MIRWDTVITLRQRIMPWNFENQSLAKKTLTLRDPHVSATISRSSSQVPAKPMDSDVTTLPEGTKQTCFFVDLESSKPSGSSLACHACTGNCHLGTSEVRLFKLTWILVKPCWMVANAEWVPSMAIDHVYCTCMYIYIYIWSICTMVHVLFIVIWFPNWTWGAAQSMSDILQV